MKTILHINGTAETMLQSFYARAQYSKSKKHRFYDAKAVELVERIDYDFPVEKRIDIRNMDDKLYFRIID